MTVSKVLELVRRFRKTDSKTPIVLMGYYNPIHAYGTARFAKDAAEAGVDGFITVDLPPEEDEVLRLPAAAQGLDIIRLPRRPPTTSALRPCSTAPADYLYYVSIAGVTGTKSLRRSRCRGPRCRGFKRAEQISPARSASASRRRNRPAISPRFADGAVVGSAIVARDRRGAAARAGARRWSQDVIEFLCIAWPNRCMQPDQLLW